MGLGLKRMNFGENKNEGLKNKKRIKEKCQKRREGLKEGREKRDFFLGLWGGRDFWRIDGREKNRKKFLGGKRYIEGRTNMEEGANLVKVEATKRGAARALAGSPKRLTLILAPKFQWFGQQRLSFPPFLSL